MNIRIATPEDAFAIQNIYRYYVDNTAITFELEVPSVKEFQERITKTLERYPYLVAEEEGEVIAYAYAGIFYDRRAYDWSAEMSVYVQRGIHGKGVGTALYEKMEELLKKQNIVNLLPALLIRMQRVKRFMRRVDMRRRHILNNVATSLASGGILYGCRR